MTLPMAGAQFKQNRTNVVKLALHCDTADTVGYSARRVCQELYTFTHDSFFPTIILTRCSTALDPHDGWAREDTL